MKKVLIIGTILIMAGVVMGQNYGTIGMPGGSLGGGELDSIQVAVIQYQESDGTNAIVLPQDTWKAIPYNTEISDQIGVTTAGDSIITIPAGKYLISWNCQASSYSSNSFFSRLMNVSDGLNYMGVQATQALYGTRLIEIASAKDFKVACYGGLTDRALQPASAFSMGNEIYGEMTIIKLN